MGIADAVTKKYLQDNEVFSDVFNYRLFNGKPVIRPENLSEMDPSEILVLSGKKQNGKRKRLPAKNLYRDLMRDTVIRRDQNAVYRLRLGMELQTHVHYAMPVRNQLYDAIEYYNQMEETALRHRAESTEGNGAGGDAGSFLSGFRREDRLIPFFTVMIHFGPEPWDGPLSLHDMMEVGDPEVLKNIPDYRIHLIEPAGLSRTELEKFQSSFREVMGCIKYSEDERALEEFMKDNPRMNMDIRAARVIGAMTGTGIEYEYGEEKEGKVNMCKAIEDMMRHSEEKGRTKERNSILDSQARLVKAGRMQAEDVADSLGVPVEKVQEAVARV